MPSVTKLEGVAKPIIAKVRDTNIHMRVLQDRILGKSLSGLQANIQAIKLVTTPDPVLLLNVQELCAEFIVNCVRWWDLTEDPNPETPDQEGPPVALTVDRLMEFGAVLLMEMVAGIVEQVKMGEANGTSTPRRSLATRTKARHSS